VPLRNPCQARDGIALTPCSAQLRIDCLLQYPSFPEIQGGYPHSTDGSDRWGRSQLLPHSLGCGTRSPLLIAALTELPAIAPKALVLWGAIGGSLATIAVERSGRRQPRQD
jgi:hypothetical protein